MNSCLEVAGGKEGAEHFGMKDCTDGLPRRITSTGAIGSGKTSWCGVPRSLSHLTSQGYFSTTVLMRYLRETC